MPHTPPSIQSLPPEDREYFEAKWLAHKELLQQANSKLATGNPWEWPYQKHVKLCLDALTPYTAILQSNYPYGTLRCVRRLWCEKATKGGQKDNWRLVTQTTQKPWNYQYTRRMEDETVSQQELQTWITEQLPILRRDYALNRASACWNKPHAEVYHLFACWETVHCWQDDTVVHTPDNALVAYRPVILGINTKPDELRNFLATYQQQSQQFSREQVNALKRIERLGRIYNPTTWTTPIDWDGYGF